MKILHVFHDHGYGGIQQHIVLLMKGLREHGHDVSFAGPKDSWIAERLLEEKFEIFHLPMHGLFDIRSHLRLWQWVKKNGIQIVHGHGVRGAYYAGKCSDIARTVCTAHSTKPPNRMGGCQKMIAITDAVKRVLTDAGNPETKISVFPHGVPDVPRGDRRALRQELGIAPETFALFNAGRFVRDKGQDILLSAMRLLKERACDEIDGGRASPRAECHLYLAGDTATEFGKEVTQQAMDMDNVHFLGYRDDVQRILPAFDVYVSASRREAFGLSLVEAFAASMPVIATNVGGVAEVVTDNKTGFLVPNEDIVALADDIEMLIGDGSARATLGHYARQRYEELFTVEAMVKKTEQVYTAMQK